MKYDLTGNEANSHMISRHTNKIRDRALAGCFWRKRHYSVNYFTSKKCGDSWKIINQGHRLVLGKYEVF